MATWETTLQKFVESGDQLPEDLSDQFQANPPQPGPWPKGIPSSKALTTFYSLCDGGTLGAFTIEGREELQDLADWDQSGEQEPGRYLIFGGTEFGHLLVWDSRDDRVGYHDEDGADGLVMDNETRSGFAGLTMEQFLSGLFSQSHKPADPEMAQSWAEALDRIA